MLPTGTSSNEIAQAVGVSVAGDGVFVGTGVLLGIEVSDGANVGVSDGANVGVPDGANVGVSVGGMYVGSGLGVGDLVAVGVEVSQGLK